MDRDLVDEPQAGPPAVGGRSAGSLDRDGALISLIFV